MNVIDLCEDVRVSSGSITTDGAGCDTVTGDGDTVTGDSVGCDQFAILHVYNVIRKSDYLGITYYELKVRKHVSINSSQL